MENLTYVYDINDYFSLKYCDLSFVLRFSQNSLFSLYQPILGITCISLYLTLNSLKDIYGKDIFTYKDILVLLQINKQQLDKSFKKLEMLKLIEIQKGLLKTNESIFIYKLNNPLNVEDFFNNEELNKIASKHIDKNYIDMINNNYNKLLDFSYSIKMSAIKKNNKINNVDEKKTNNKIDNTNESFNYSNFYELISNIFSEMEVLDNNRDYIVKRSKLYSLNTYDMIDICRQVKNFNNNDEFIKKFDLSLERYLIKKDKSTNKKSTFTSSPNTKTYSYGDNKSSIKQIKEYSPQKYIKYITGSLTPMDIKNISVLSEQYCLTSEAINCLYNFVVFKYKTVNFNLIEKIANSWNKEKINTFEEAIEFLKRKGKKNTKNNRKLIKINKYDSKKTFKEKELLKQITKI